MTTAFNNNVIRLKIKIDLIHIFNMFSQTSDLGACGNMFILSINSIFIMSFDTSMTNTSTIVDFLTILSIEDDNIWTDRNRSEFVDLLHDVL